MFLQVLFEKKKTCIKHAFNSNFDHKYGHDVPRGYLLKEDGLL